MILLANLLNAIAVILGSLIWFLNILIIASVIMSWVSADPRNPLVQFVRNTTEPLFYRVRRYIPPFGMLDLSPIVVLLALQFLNVFLVQTLTDYAHDIKRQTISTTISSS